MNSPTLQFQSSASEATLRVLEVSGEEALSRPYRFDLRLSSTDPALPLDAMLGKPASLTIADRTIHGVLIEVDQEDAVGPDEYAYRVTLGSRLSLLSIARQTRTFTSLSAPQLVQAVLALSGIDLAVESRLDGQYLPRPHTVQYQETALDFVSRVLEQAGIGYFFSHDDRGERLVLCDHAAAYDAELTTQLGGGLRSLGCKRRLMPKTLVLVDHNERTPELPLQAELEVDERGVGTQIDASDAFASPEDGAALAVMRADELRCRAEVYHGSSLEPLTAGARLSISNHFRADFNRTYLLTRVSHRLFEAPYECAFEAIPAAQTFRPARTTARPRLAGPMVAHVDARGPDGTAAADAEGRYRVTMPFDLSGAAEAQRSMAMRLATPYGGAEEGLSFTLRKGTEVLWTGVDGDPDRPVITGVVPNARSRVVTDKDAVGSRLQMPNGAVFEMGKGAGTPATRSTQSSGHDLPREQHLADPVSDHAFEQHQGTGNTPGEDWIRLGVPHTANGTAGKFSYLRYGEKTQNTLNSTAEGKAVSFGEQAGLGTWDWASLNSGYDQTDAAPNRGEDAHFAWDKSDGVYDYTDGNRTMITRGTLQSLTEGNRTDVVLGNYRLVIPNRTLGIHDADFYSMTFTKGFQGWRKITQSHVSTVNLAYGDNCNFFTGINFGATLGGNYTLGMGFNCNLFFGLNASLNAGMTCNFSYGPILEFGGTRKVSTAGVQDVKAREKVHLSIRSTYNKGWDHAKPAIAALSAAAGGAVLGSAGAAAGSLDLKTGGAVTAVVWGVPTAVVAGAAVAYHYLADKKESTTPNDSEIILKPDEIVLRCGVNGPSIRLSANGIEFHGGPGGINQMSIRNTANAASNLPVGIHVATAGASLDLHNYCEIKAGANELNVYPGSAEFTVGMLFTQNGTY